MFSGNTLEDYCSIEDKAKFCDYSFSRVGWYSSFKGILLSLSVSPLTRTWKRTFWLNNHCLLSRYLLAIPEAWYINHCTQSAFRTPNQNLSTVLTQTDQMLWSYLHNDYVKLHFWFCCLKVKRNFAFFDDKSAVSRITIILQHVKKGDVHSLNAFAWPLPDSPEWLSFTLPSALRTSFLSQMEVQRHV